MLVRPSLRFVAAVAVCVASFVGAALVAPHVELAPRAAYGLAFACVVAEIVWVSRLAVIPSPRVLAASVLATAGLLLSRRGADVDLLGAAIVTSCLLVGATLLGAGLGARIERAGHLLAVAAISGVADLWSVYDPAGLSSQMAEQAAKQPDRLALFALPWPMFGTGDTPPIIGAGDVLFTALYLATFARHGLSQRRAVMALVLAYAVGFAAILITERPVPLLPLLGTAALLADARARSLPAQERRIVAIMLAVLCGLLVVRFSR